jgi:ERCC4-related helicase
MNQKTRAIVKNIPWSWVSLEIPKYLSKLSNLGPVNGSTTNLIKNRMIQGLLSNKIIYLPTGSGKTMVAAMIAAYMKKINPKKKVFFICDRIPLVFQQATYLRNQISASTVGEFCSEHKIYKQSELNYDIFVMTAGYLLNLLGNNTLHMEDCCCLIIDEIHHASSGGHAFNKIVEKYCKNLDVAMKPRIIGLTASPSSASASMDDMRKTIISLCQLIEGTISMPLVYKADFETIIIRPAITFHEIEPDVGAKLFMANVFEHIRGFVKIISPELSTKFSQSNLHNLKSFLNNSLVRPNTKSKEFSVIRFLQKLLNSLEILSILGLNETVAFIHTCVAYEKNHNPNAWSTEERCLLLQLDEFAMRFSGDSGKIKVLCNLLNDNRDENSRVIVFVRQRKTCRLLCDYLLRLGNDAIDNFWRPCVFVGHAGNLALT